MSDNNTELIEQTKIEEKPLDNFDEMNLQSKLLRGIYGYGFEKP